MKSLYKEAEELLERFHDERIHRKVLSEEISVFVLDILLDLRKRKGTFAIQELKRIERQMEREIMLYAVQRRGWRPKDRPLEIKLDLTMDGRPHMDISGGVLAPEIRIAIEDLLLFHEEPMPWGDEVEEEEDELANSDFIYGG